MLMMLLSRAGLTSSWRWMACTIHCCGDDFLLACSRSRSIGSWSGGSIWTTRSATRSLLTMSIWVEM